MEPLQVCTTKNPLGRNKRRCSRLSPSPRKARKVLTESYQHHGREESAARLGEGYGDAAGLELTSAPSPYYAVATTFGLTWGQPAASIWTYAPHSHSALVAGGEEPEIGGETGLGIYQSSTLGLSLLQGLPHPSCEIDRTSHVWTLEHPEPVSASPSGTHGSCDTGPLPLVSSVGTRTDAPLTYIPCHGAHILAKPAVIQPLSSASSTSIHNASICDAMGDLMDPLLAASSHDPSHENRPPIDTHLTKPVAETSLEYSYTATQTAPYGSGRRPLPNDHDLIFSRSQGSESPGSGPLMCHNRSIPLNGPGSSLVVWNGESLPGPATSNPQLHESGELEAKTAGGAQQPFHTPSFLDCDSGTSVSQDQPARRAKVSLPASDKVTPSFASTPIIGTLSIDLRLAQSATIVRDSRSCDPTPAESAHVSASYTNDNQDDYDPERKRRGRFSEEERKETGKTRAIGACIRCRYQRVRCKPNPRGPKEPCETCLNVSTTSKKVIHHLPCTRDKLSNVELCRRYGLTLTQRWRDTRVKDVGDWADNVVRTIRITLGICDRPIELRVRKFVPREGDICYRRWKDSTGRDRIEWLAPYALADYNETAEMFVAYIKEHTLHSFRRAAHDADPLVQRTFDQALRHYESLPHHYDCSKKYGDDISWLAKQKDLLRKTMTLWFTIKHSTGSSWLCGEDNLGMAPVRDPDYPLKDRIATPRMVVAQFDPMYHDKILKKLSKEVLTLFESLIRSNNPKCWFTVYLVTFILLQQASHQSADRDRWAQENSQPGKYGKGAAPEDATPALVQFVERCQESANVILAHWQYYKRELNIESIDPSQPGNSPLKHLTHEQISFIKDTVQQLKTREHELQQLESHVIWDHDLYFVSQMFEQKWRPRPTFTA